MSLTLNLVIYGLIFAYLAVGSVNFFLPIGRVVAVAILIGSTVLALASSRVLPIGMFTSAPLACRASKRLIIAAGLGLVVWSTIVIWRPTVGDDAISYHLPLSLLMNHSIWYPGIAKLSSHYGFPNGISALASIFTAFDILSLENIPNLVCWIVFGSGIFLYLRRRGSPSLQSGLVTLVFMLSPDLFWQSYNMGTDLPAAAFLTFGLLAWADRRWYESYLFLGLSAIFKPLGTLTVLLITPFLLYRRVQGDETMRFSQPQLGIAALLLTLTLLRVYVATGNPFYPSWPVNLADWGISTETQQAIIHGVGSQSDAGLREYVGVERTLVGYLSFMYHFIAFPHLVKSSYWFSPFFLALLIVGTYYFVTEKCYRTVSQQFWYTLFIVHVLFAAWLLYSPIFRFAAGIFMFLTMHLVLFFQNGRRSAAAKWFVHSAGWATLILFSLNVGRHIDDNVVGVIRYTPAAVSKWMPWEGVDKSKFSKEQTADGFLFSKTSATYCVKMPPPCISLRSLADDGTLIEDYRRYNGY